MCEVEIKLNKIDEQLGQARPQHRRRIYRTGRNRYARRKWRTEDTYTLEIIAVRPLSGVSHFKLNLYL